MLYNYKFVSVALFYSLFGSCLNVRTVEAQLFDQYEEPTKHEKDLDCDL